MRTFDIAVIGGGASGMSAAICASRLGCRVCLAEAQPRVGKKLLATGNGRCNLSNSRLSPENAAEFYRCDAPPLLESLFASCPPERVLGFLRSLGLELRDEQGRLYPRSEKAGSVLELLRAELEHLGVETFCDAKAERMHKNSGAYIINLRNNAEIAARRVIVACGSPAAPALSGSDSGTALMAGLGHKPRPFTPALAPIAVQSPYLRQLKGTRVHCSASLIHRNEPLHGESGELQFNENNLSGIMMFQLAARLPKGDMNNAVIRIDLLPEQSESELANMLKKRADALGHLQNEAFLAGLFPKPLAQVLLKRARISAADKAGESMDSKNTQALSAAIKRFDFSPTGTGGFAQAQTASGGVALSELTSSLESRLSKGLYCCGELIDCDGDCGGFNLHFAWLSGIVSGEAAANSLKSGANLNENR